MVERTLDGRTAIVTGASRGIGKVIARRLAAEGAQTVVCSRDSDRIESAAADVRRELGDDAGEVHPVECDVTVADDVRSLVDATVSEFGGVDLLVNNAGGSLGEDGKIHAVDEETWEQNLALNLTGPYLCSREVVPVMADDGGGSIVHVSSVNATTGIGAGAYSAAKAGLYSLSRNIAVQYGGFGVRSNVVSLGTIQTETREETMDEDSGDDSERRWRDQYPLGRFGDPEEVAEAVLFLGSDRGSFVTGSNLTVDGGLTAGLSQSFQRDIYDVDRRPSRDDV